MLHIHEHRQNDGLARNTSCFSEPSLAILQNMMYEYKVPAGSHIFWEGDPANKLHYILKGRVKITKANSEGKEFVLYLFQEGDLWGQFDPYDDSTQGYNARAACDCVIGVIQKSDLEVVLWEHGSLAFEFMNWMGIMHRLTQTKFRDLMLNGKQGALCSTLIRLANSYGKPHGEHILISEKLTNTELADFIGAARESVNRMLGELRKADALTFENGHIVIKSLDYLSDICHCAHCPKEICRI